MADLNAQLEEAQEQLVQSERLRALGEMAAGVAHDINNALGIIIGNAQLARRKLDPDSKVLKSIDGIELAAKDAAETVRRLREIGKPIDTSGYQTLDLSEIVDDVVRAAVPAWRESGSHGGAEISVETNLARNCFIKGNATELREALANILLNSVLGNKDQRQDTRSPPRAGSIHGPHGGGYGHRNERGNKETASRSVLYDPGRRGHRARDEHGRCHRDKAPGKAHCGVGRRRWNDVLR